MVNACLIFIYVSGSDTTYDEVWLCYAWTLVALLHGYTRIPVLYFANLDRSSTPNSIAFMLELTGTMGHQSYTCACCLASATKAFYFCTPSRIVLFDVSDQGRFGLSPSPNIEGGEDE